MTKEKKTKQSNKVKVKEVFQTEACECGAACLSMILSFYGCSVPLEEIRYECGISRDGCTAKDLVLAGSHYGLKGHAYKVSLEKLKDAPKPAILHWNFQHFVVLLEVNKKGAVINDPAKGRRRVSFEELDENYTGIFISYDVTPAFKKQEDENSNRNLIKNRLFVDKAATRYLVVSGLLLMVPDLLIPVVSNLFIDNVFGTGARYISFLVLAMGILYFYQLFLTLLRTFVLDRLKIKLSAISAQKLLNKMYRLPMQFYEQRYSGELATRLESDNQANNFLVGDLIEAVLDIASAAACLILMFIYNWQLTLVGLVGTAVSVFVTRLISYKIEALNMKKQQDKSTLSGVLCAGISASESIKACGVENEYSAEILGRYANLTTTEQTIGDAQQRIDAITPAISSLFSMVVLIVGALISINGSMTVGMLMAFSMLLSSFTTPVNRLLGFVMSYETMKALFSRVLDIELATGDPRFSKNTKKEYEKRCPGSITVKNIRYGYNPNLPPVIDGISFSVTAGSRIGIVGASGCGKSTLGKIICGMISPWEGQVFLGKVPLQDIPDKWICGTIAYISQKGDFFAGSIQDNITMWKTERSGDELYRALRDAQLEEMISSLKGGVNYQLVEGAKNISGGQRQRLQIARGLMTNPDILVLDEATSALDTITETKIMKAIEKRGCTCIIVAHRLSTIRDCDLILVLDRGTIAEAGTHEQLLLKQGLYAELAADSE